MQESNICIISVVLELIVTHGVVQVASRPRAIRVVARKGRTLEIILHGSVSKALRIERENAMSVS